MIDFNDVDEREKAGIINLDEAGESEKADFRRAITAEELMVRIEKDIREAFRQRRPPVSIISLGPGDPELITLKGLRLLREADRIYCPATAGADGSLSSRAADILQALGIDPSTVRLFPVAMHDDRAAAQADYGAAVERIAAECAAGRRVAVTAEGDAGFYSSSGYVSALLAAQGIATTRIAGVPAFVACAASEGVVIAEQTEETDVLTHLVSADELLRRVTAGCSVVLMKPSRYASAVKEALVQAPAGVAFHYFEHTGATRSFYTCCRDEIARRRFPYFSLLIVRKG